MGRLGDDMELIWAIILPNFKLWKMHGKKVEAMHLSYGKTIPIAFPYIWSVDYKISSMGLIWSINM